MLSLYIRLKNLCLLFVDEEISLSLCGRVCKLDNRVERIQEESGKTERNSKKCKKKISDSRISLKRIRQLATILD
jgi:hypothetical protein